MTIMELHFIDTNIGIGYTIYPDRFHPSVEEFIEKDNIRLVWSTFTQDEYNEKYDAYISKIEKFMNHVWLILHYQRIDSYYAFEKAVLKKTKSIKIDIHKKIKLIECIYNYPTFNLTIPSTFNISRKQILEHFERKKYTLLNIVELFDCGADNYKKFDDLIKALKEIGIHYPDYVILIDAHVLSQDTDLTFTTADFKLYEKIIKHTNTLNIKRYNLIEG